MPKSLNYLWFVFLTLVLSSRLAAKDAPVPKIVRTFPLGGQQGTSVSVEILGEFLSNAESVEFDCRDLAWTKTLSASSGKLTGIIAIQPHASLGPHMLRVLTLDGPSTSGMFNVGQFPSPIESEPNDGLKEAQRVTALPAEIQGRLDGAADVDVYAIRSRAGERWTFDFQSIEYGSAVEAKMALLDSEGKRLVSNDDRNDFDETPFLEHTFTQDGLYHIRLDQYRGPRGFNFGKNCSYILRISSLPTIYYSTPLGVKVGRTTRMRLSGTALDSLQSVYLTEIRRAEYARMTYPYTMPIRFRPDPPSAEQLARIKGEIVGRKYESAEVSFNIPAGTQSGLWRLWGAGPQGTFAGMTVELSEVDEYDEAQAPSANWTKGEYAINGVLQGPGEEDVYRINALAGRPLHFWTLAAQLGIPQLDTVLQLRDATGKKLAESDDVVAGQGTLIGNPDSSLYYLPQQDGPLSLAVKDRVGRGGQSYRYRLKVKSETPSFQLMTTPENLIVPRGGSTDVKVHLVREAGFEGEVSVWFDGMPPGVTAPQGTFRADQRFEPNADGADMIIPEISFPIQVPESLQPGAYPIRMLGVSSAERDFPERRVVQAQTTLTLGPLLDLWNFIRRPLPGIFMVVVEPFDARLSTQAQSLDLARGASITLELKAENVPESATFEVKSLPAGVNYRLAGRQDDQVTLSLEASPDAPLGVFDVSAETKVGSRWAATRPILLTISPAQKSISQSN